VRNDQRKWIDEQAWRAERAAARGDEKELYSITKMLSKKGFNRNRPIRNKEDKLLTTPEEQVSRWKEHFSEVLNRDSGLERKKQSNLVDKDPNIDLHPPSRAEIKIALKQMKSGKAPGLDNITPQVLKVDVETSIDLLYLIFVKIWMEEKLPADWKKGMIVKLPKKGDTTSCNNWRSITLLSVPSKVFSKNILNRKRLH
jgi:hypothetical protein